MTKIEGRNPVIEAFKGKRQLNKIYIQEGIRGDKIDRIITQARNNKVKIERVSRNRLTQMASSHAHQGVIAMAEPIKLSSIRQILELAGEKGEAPLVIILDQIQDPHNFGAIIRTGYAAGAHGLVFQKKRAATITPVVIKSSAGAVEHFKLAEVANINYAINELKDAGLWIAGADMEGEKSYFAADLKGPVGLVIGNEGEGLHRLVKERCDFLIKIPMQGKLGSLNASVAAAILIFEVVRQRSQI
jgi:23S rRNA (guanosine2251-2'-O)-methyltransferase